MHHCTAADLNVFLLNIIMTVTNYLCGAGKRTLAMHLVKHKEPIIVSAKYSAVPTYIRANLVRYNLT